MFWETQAGWRNSFVSQKLSASVRQTCVAYIEHYSDCHNSRSFLFGFFFFCMTLTSCSQPCIVRHFSTSISSPFSALSIYISMYVYIYVHIPLYKLSSHIIIVFSRCSRPPPLPTLNCFCCSDRFLLFLFFLFLRSCSPFHFSFPLPKRQRVLYVVSFCLTAQTTLLLLLCFFFFLSSLSLSLSLVSAPVCVASLQLHSHTTFLYLFGFAS